MKNYKLLFLLLLTSCSDNTVFFWNWKDVIGFSLLGILSIIIILWYLIDWVKSLFKRKK